MSVEFLWGLGIHSVESFTPVKLGDVLESSDQAATILGPANTVAWLVAAGGAALVPLLTRRLSPAGAGAFLRIAQGITVLGIAFALGPIGVVVAYVLAIGINGASNPIHQGMLHRGVDDGKNRATVVSVNSLTGQTGAMLGGIALGLLADATSLTIFPYAHKGSNSFTVRVDLPQGLTGLFPGMFIKTSFQIGVKQALLVPRQAVVYRSEVTAVYVVDQQGGVHFRRIRVGHPVDAESIEVISGLEAGERVALEPIAAGSELKRQLRESGDD